MPILIGKLLFVVSLLARETVRGAESQALVSPDEQVLPSEVFDILDMYC